MNIRYKSFFVSIFMLCLPLYVGATSVDSNLLRANLFELQNLLSQLKGQINNSENIDVQFAQVSALVDETQAVSHRIIQCPNPELTTSLRKGTRSQNPESQVESLQAFLWQYKADNENWNFPQNREDFVVGVFGKKTENIVKAFQKEFMGMEPGQSGFGIVGPLTRAEIINQCEQSIPPHTPEFIVSVSPVPSSRVIVAGGRQVEFARYIFDATQSSEGVKLNTIPLYFDTDAQRTDLANCQLYDNNSSLNPINKFSPAQNNIASSTILTFDGVGFILDVGTTKTLSLRCDIRSGISGSKYWWGIDSAQNASYMGVIGINSGVTIEEAFIEANGNKMTVRDGGSYTVANDTSLLYRIVQAGTTDVPLARFNVEAGLTENISLNQMALQLGGVASNSPSDLLNQRVTIWSDGIQRGSATFGVGSSVVQDYATSTTLNIPINAGDFKTVSIKGSFTNINGNEGTPGAYVRVFYDGDNNGLGGNYAKGLSSGSSIPGPETGRDGVDDIATPGVRVFRSVPTVQDVTSGIIPLTVGGNLLQIKITAGARAINLSKISFDVATSGVMVRKFQLYGPNGAVNINPVNAEYSRLFSNGYVPSDSRVHIYFDRTNPDRLIQANTSKVYAVRVNEIVGSQDGVLSLRLREDKAYPALSTLVGRDYQIARGVSHTSNFVWTGFSTTTPLINPHIQDFSNGYGVSGFPMQFKSFLHDGGGQSGTGLTQAQINSIINLLWSFGASNDAIENAKIALTGGTAQSSGETNLSLAQIDSIIALLEAFGASDSIITNMKIALTPTSQPRLTVIKPNGGEQWVLKNSHTILWEPYNPQTGLNTHPTVQAYLDQKVGDTFVEVGKVIEAGKASIHWDGQINNYNQYPEPGDYYVRIVNTVTGESDRSNASFKLLASDTLKADLKINGSDGPIASPTGDSSTKMRVEWSSNITTNTCTIYNNTAPYNSIDRVFTQLSPTGSMYLNIYPNTNNYDVSINIWCSSIVPEGSASDYVVVKPAPSDNPFVTMISPRGGENINYNSRIYVTATHSADVSSVTFILYKNNASYKTIAANVPTNSSGAVSVYWDIPSMLTVNELEGGAHVFKIYAIGHRPSIDTVTTMSGAFGLVPPKELDTTPPVVTFLSPHESPHATTTNPIRIAVKVTDNVDLNLSSINCDFKQNDNTSSAFCSMSCRYDPLDAKGRTAFCTTLTNNFLSSGLDGNTISVKVQDSSGNSGLVSAHVRYTPISSPPTSLPFQVITPKAGAQWISGSKYATEWYWPGNSSKFIIYIIRTSPNVGAQIHGPYEGITGINSKTINLGGLIVGTYYVRVCESDVVPAPSGANCANSEKFQIVYPGQASLLTSQIQERLEYLGGLLLQLQNKIPQ